MKRRLMVCSTLLVALVALMPSLAAAGTLEASGSVTQTSFTITDSRTVGGVTFFAFEETDSLTGTFTGDTSLTGECVAFSSGETLCKADESFTGTVAGASGTMQFTDLIRIDTNTGAFEGQFVIVGATGELTNIHGRGTFAGTGTTGTYSGRLAVGP